jgi:hypothetical protein
MSQLGQKRKWPGFSGMSGPPPEADIASPPRHVRKVPISEVGNLIQSRHHDYFFFRPDKCVCAVFQLPDLMHSAIAWLQSGMQPVRSGLPLQYATHLPFSCEQLFPVICAQLGVATNPRAIIQPSDYNLHGSPPRLDNNEHTILKVLPRD